MADMIGRTDAISLITGKPGSGKSLRLAKFIREASEAGEVVYCCNVEKLKLPHIPMEDPTDWRSLPPGSVLVIDEAQRYFRARRGGEPPDYIKAMETIRHDGIRLILASQQPDYIDSHIRGLVGLHEHLVREHGKEQSKIWRHVEVMENVRSDRARARYDTETWPFDKTLYEAYESAEVHTVKPVMTARWKRGLVFLSLAALLLGGGVFWARKSFSNIGPDSAVAEKDGAPKRAVVPLPSGSSRDNEPPRTIEEYAAQLTPRIAEAPWSAPLYDDRTLTADPLVICAIGQAGENSQGKQTGESCFCMTEQGTPYTMADDEKRSGDARCRHVARWGQAYNPFKQQQQERSLQDSRDEEPKVQEPQVGNAARTPDNAAAGQAAGVASYGAMGTDSRQPQQVP